MKDVPLARLLIVDDDSDQVEMSCRLLRAQGYLTIGVTSGSQAINVLRAAAVDETTKFDALITDLVMPVMDGITLLRVAHGIDEDLVSIVMTGHGTIDTAVEAMKSGALDYILKPFRLKVALPVVERSKVDNSGKEICQSGFDCAAIRLSETYKSLILSVFGE